MYSTGNTRPNVHGTEMNGIQMEHRENVSYWNSLSSFTVQSVLNIEIAASILGGNLTCRASNEHGEAVSESSLTVLTGKGLRI